MAGAFETGKYRNVFAEYGYPEAEIQRRVEQTFETIFYGNEEERFYHEVGADMAYIEDTGNHDVRTEGMSYGMMACVQMNRREEFDRLWKWTRTYMYSEDGPFHYADEARAILRECIHKGEPGHPGEPMWDTSRHLIKFITNCNFSDPSYHLPHFYELFARWADEDDREFWRGAAEASRAYLHLACHPDTGLSAEYAEYDGTPHEGDQEIFGRHDWYYSDAYRTIANIAMDWLWFGRDPWQQEIAGKLQSFYCEKQSGHWDGVFLTDGTLLRERALHPVAVIAVNAEASLAAKGENAKECIRRFWETPLRTGERRYYDNFLYLFAMLALSGNYRIY